MSWSWQTGGNGPSGPPRDMGDMLDIFRRKPLPRDVLPPSTLRLTEEQAAALPDTAKVSRFFEDKTVARHDYYMVFDNDEDKMEFMLRYL